MLCWSGYLIYLSFPTIFAGPLPATRTIDSIKYNFRSYRYEKECDL